MYSIRQALEVTLGTEPAGVEEGTAEEEESLGDLGERSWAALGGDSLAAIQFARRVSEACGVSLPVSYVLDKSRTLDGIASHVQALVRCVCVCHGICHGSPALRRSACAGGRRMCHDTEICQGLPARVHIPVMVWEHRSTPFWRMCLCLPWPARSCAYLGDGVGTRIHAG